MNRCRPKKLYVKLKATTSEVKELDPINEPTDVVKAATKLIGDRAYEVFLVLYLNVKNCVFAYEEFTEGSTAGVTVVPSTVVRNAVLAGAVGVITVHQHPSGSPQPSREDQHLWEKLRIQAALMDLQLLDNIIVTDDKTRFFSEMGS